MKNVLFEQENIKLWNKWQFVQNKMGINAEHFKNV
jgi:hypothetical protein